MQRWLRSLTRVVVRSALAYSFRHVISFDPRHVAAHIGPVDLALLLAEWAWLPIVPMQGSDLVEQQPRADRQASGPSAGSRRIRVLYGPNSELMANHAPNLKCKPNANQMQTNLILSKPCPNFKQTKHSHEAHDSPYRRPILRRSSRATHGA